jgi:hypothetical protein
VKVENERFIDIMVPQRSQIYGDFGQLREDSTRANMGLSTIIILIVVSIPYFNYCHC